MVRLAVLIVVAVIVGSEVCVTDAHVNAEVKIPVDNGAEDSFENSNVGKVSVSEDMSISSEDSDSGGSDSDERDDNGKRDDENDESDESDEDSENNEDNSKSDESNESNELAQRNQSRGVSESGEKESVKKGNTTGSYSTEDNDLTEGSGLTKSKDSDINNKSTEIGDSLENSESNISKGLVDKSKSVEIEDLNKNRKSNSVENKNSESTENEKSFESSVSTKNEESVANSESTERKSTDENSESTENKDSVDSTVFSVSTTKSKTTKDNKLAENSESAVQKKVLKESGMSTDDNESTDNDTGRESSKSRQEGDSIKNKKGSTTIRSTKNAVKEKIPPKPKSDKKPKKKRDVSDSGIVQSISDGIYIRNEDLHLSSNPKHIILDLSSKGRSKAKNWSSILDSLSKGKCGFLPSESNDLSAITILMDSPNSEMSPVESKESQTVEIIIIDPSNSGPKDLNESGIDGRGTTSINHPSTSYKPWYDNQDSKIHGTTGMLENLMSINTYDEQNLSESSRTEIDKSEETLSDEFDVEGNNLINEQASNIYTGAESYEASKGQTKIFFGNSKLETMSTNEPRPRNCFMVVTEDLKRSMSDDILSQIALCPNGLNLVLKDNQLVADGEPLTTDTKGFSARILSKDNFKICTFLKEKDLIEIFQISEYTSLNTNNLRQGTSSYIDGSTSEVEEEFLVESNNARYGVDDNKSGTFEVQYGSSEYGKTGNRFEINGKGDGTTVHFEGGFPVGNSNTNNQMSIHTDEQSTQDNWYDKLVKDKGTNSIKGNNQNSVRIIQPKELFKSVGNSKETFNGHWDGVTDWGKDSQELTSFDNSRGTWYDNSDTENFAIVDPAGNYGFKVSHQIYGNSNRNGHNTFAYGTINKNVETPSAIGYNTQFEGCDNCDTGVNHSDSYSSHSPDSVNTGTINTYDRTTNSQIYANRNLNKQNHKTFGTFDSSKETRLDNGDISFSEWYVNSDMKDRMHDHELNSFENTEGNWHDKSYIEKNTNSEMFNTNGIKRNNQDHMTGSHSMKYTGINNEILSNIKETINNNIAVNQCDEYNNCVTEEGKNRYDSGIYEETVRNPYDTSKAAISTGDSSYGLNSYNDYYMDSDQSSGNINRVYGYYENRKNIGSGSKEANLCMGYNCGTQNSAISTTSNAYGLVGGNQNPITRNPSYIKTDTIDRDYGDSQETYDSNRDISYSESNYGNYGGNQDYMTDNPLYGTTGDSYVSDVERKETGNENKYVSLCEGYNCNTEDSAIGISDNKHLSKVDNQNDVLSYSYGNTDAIYDNYSNNRETYSDRPSVNLCGIYYNCDPRKNAIPTGDNTYGVKRNNKIYIQSDSSNRNNNVIYGNYGYNKETYGSRMGAFLCSRYRICVTQKSSNEATYGNGKWNGNWYNLYNNDNTNRINKNKINHYETWKNLASRSGTALGPMFGIQRERSTPRITYPEGKEWPYLGTSVDSASLRGTKTYLGTRRVQSGGLKTTNYGSVAYAFPKSYSLKYSAVPTRIPSKIMRVIYPGRTGHYSEQNSLHDSKISHQSKHAAKCSCRHSVTKKSGHIKAFPYSFKGRNDRMRGRNDLGTYSGAGFVSHGGLKHYPNVGEKRYSGETIHYVGEDNIVDAELVDTGRRTNINPHNVIDNKRNLRGISGGYETSSYPGVLQLATTDPKGTISNNQELSFGKPNHYTRLISEGILSDAKIQISSDEVIPGDGTNSSNYMTGMGSSYDGTVIKDVLIKTENRSINTKVESNTNNKESHNLLLDNQVKVPEGLSFFQQNARGITTDTNKASKANNLSGNLENFRHPTTASRSTTIDRVNSTETSTSNTFSRIKANL